MSWYWALNVLEEIFIDAVDKDEIQQDLEIVDRIIDVIFEED